MGLLEALTSSPLVSDVGWTILHFMWQGTAIGILAAVVLATMRRTSPGARHLVAAIAMGLMLLAPIVTLSLMIALRPDPSPGAAGSVAGSASAIAAVPTIADRLAPALPWVTVAWLLGAAMFHVRFLARLGAVHRLRTRGTSPLPADWRARVARLHETLGLRRSIDVVQSSLATVPMVVGWLRPVVLVPTCALTGLSTAQLQAIIAHELGHVRRHDHLINLLQALIECLLFFHPAVWWLSERLRIEREYCCDDIAVTACGSVRTYAEALSSLDIIGADRAVLASNGGSLMNRIARLAGSTPTRRKRHGGWATPLLIVIMASAAGTAAAIVPGDDDDRTTEIRELMRLVEHIAAQLGEVEARAEALGRHDEDEHGHGGAHEQDARRAAERAHAQARQREVELTRAHAEHADEHANEHAGVHGSHDAADALHEHLMQRLHDALRAHFDEAVRHFHGDDAAKDAHMQDARHAMERFHAEHAREIEEVHRHVREREPADVRHGQGAARHRRINEGESRVHRMRQRGAELHDAMRHEEAVVEDLLARGATEEAIEVHLARLEDLHRAVADHEEGMEQAERVLVEIHGRMIDAEEEEGADRLEIEGELQEAMRHLHLREREIQREAEHHAQRLEAEMEALRSDIESQERMVELEMRRAMSELEEQMRLMELEEQKQRHHVDVELEARVRELRTRANTMRAEAERQLARFEEGHPERAQIEREVEDAMSALKHAEEAARMEAERAIREVELDLKRGAVHLDAARERHELEVAQREMELRRDVEQAMRNHEMSRADFERELANARADLEAEADEVHYMVQRRADRGASDHARREVHRDIETVHPRTRRAHADDRDAVADQLDALRDLLRAVQEELETLLHADDHDDHEGHDDRDDRDDD